MSLRNQPSNNTYLLNHCPRCGKDTYFVFIEPDMSISKNSNYTAVPTLWRCISCDGVVKQTHLSDHTDDDAPAG